SRAAADQLRAALAAAGRRELRATVLAELAATLEDLAEPDAAARHWAEAYTLVRDGVRPPEGMSRERLARRAEAAFRAAGNRFQAQHFARLAGNGG
ncbi:hypothetical protein GTW43_30220, partial [Streptomyces sp. SID5785]|uniref:hypothetical protein n=1 Tax=Streptomyces sp. SID5785 TaxID=2690309 RepID=UPI001361AEBA